MTAEELYEALNKAKIPFEVVEVFEGSRHIQVTENVKDTFNI